MSTGISPSLDYAESFAALVRDGSARHQELLVSGGHERSYSASADRRSQAVHRYDLERPSSVGQGSNPSASAQDPLITRSEALHGS
jgi:hypothetical protein